MGIARHFLGWNQPMLPATARWLSQRFATGDRWDLSSVTVVVPGRRAARRLLELLVREAANRTLFPPKLVTLGALPDLLCESDQPVAGELPSMFGRVAALRAASDQALAALTQRRPAKDDVVGWWELADDVRKLSEELAGAGLRIGDVPARAAEVGFDLRHLERFAALDEVEQAYHAKLTAAGLVDRQEARLRAVEAGRCRCDGSIVLVATVDPPPLLGRMLDLAGRSQDVTALIHAPAEHAEGFDGCGGIRPAYWRDQRVSLNDESIRFVDRPMDQAREVVKVLASASAQSPISPDQVTVGLGDEAMAGAVRRTLELADVPARFGPGQPVLKSRPATLLAALGDFADDRRLDDFAQLLRHPDMEQHVSRQGEPRAWLTLLDGYATEHLQARLDGDWLGSPDRQASLKAMWNVVAALLPAEPARTQPLHKWSEPILDALRQVYGRETIIRHDAQQHALGEALSAIADVLREQAGVDAQAMGVGEVPPVTLSQAVALTLRRLESAGIAETDGRSAVELIGYLELQLDDAPHLIVTGMNEGAVPSAPHVDPLLPDTLRTKLGLANHARRYARDLMMLAAIVASRPHVTFIAGRRSAQGDPLAPSRLLLACDDQAMARRVDAFYRDDDAPFEPTAPMLLTPGKRDRFLIPPPLLDEPVLDRLSVSAFRDYLACRYRFYLKHVRRLGAVDDAAVEMDALVFGSLAHDVLERFGESACAAATAAKDVADFFRDTLDDCVRDRFGAVHRPAVRLQVEQLRERLVAFAPHQARLASEGWRVVARGVEQRLEAAIDVDGEAFTIVGRVDRIDHHPEHGYRILDYKTAGSGKRPEKTHRGRRDGVEVWTDLQLPLYRDLCAPLGVCGQVEVGYINLPRKLSETGLAVAQWSEADFDDARAERDRIIRALRACEFWPPQEPPSYADEFTGLCADLAMDRAEVIAASFAEGGEAT